MAEILVHHVREAGLYLESTEELLRALCRGVTLVSYGTGGGGTQGTQVQLESRNDSPAWCRGPGHVGVAW